MKSRISLSVTINCRIDGPEEEIRHLRPPWAANEAPLSVEFADNTIILRAIDPAPNTADNCAVGEPVDENKREFQEAAPGVPSTVCITTKTEAEVCPKRPNSFDPSRLEEADVQTERMYDPLLRLLRR